MNPPASTNCDLRTPLNQVRHIPSWVRERNLITAVGLPTMRNDTPKELLDNLRDTVRRLDADQKRIGLNADHTELKRLLQKRIADLETALVADPLSPI